MIKITLLFFTLFHFFITSSFAVNLSQKLFVSSLKSFKLGKYQNSINLLKKIKSKNKKILGQKNYFIALNYNRLQSYDKSIPFFKRAIKNKYLAKDIYYEYAQALLANNELEISRRAFIRSYKKKFKIGSSLYYMAYISQLLGQPKLARSYYKKVLKSKTSQKALLQGSAFQIGEANLELSRKNKNTKKKVKKYVLPQFEKALLMNPTGTIASDIKSRVLELQNEFDLNPLKMKNKRMLSSKKTVGNITATWSKDNNITTQDDDTINKATTPAQNSSSIYKVEGYINRRFILKRRFIISPEFRINKQSYADDYNSAVWQNASYSVIPAIKTLSEHSLFNRPASFIFDYDFSYLAKAHTKAGKRNKDSVTKTYAFGERFQFFSFGETTMKYSIADTKSAISDASNTDAKTFSLDQIMMFKSVHIFIMLYNRTSTDYINDTSQSTSSNLFRVDYIYSKFFFNTQLQLGVALTKQDYTDAATAKSKGRETTTSPTVKITKTFTKNWKLSVDYTGTKLSSEYTTLQGGTNYSKSVYTLEAKYSF